MLIFDVFRNVLSNAIAFTMLNSRLQPLWVEIALSELKIDSSMITKEFRTQLSRLEIDDLVV